MTKTIQDEVVVSTGYTPKDKTTIPNEKDTYQKPEQPFKIPNRIIFQQSPRKYP